MPLTRLDNLISSKTGKYLYVSPDDFNATDALSNRGNSPVTPFKSIQRAFLEIARYSYLPGFGNDRFDQFTIMLMPGIHYIDNRPGLVDNTGIPEFGFDPATNAWTDDSIVDISNPDNIFWKFNNTEGGAIIPRGSSLVGYDLRRTVVRPLFVPDPAVTEREIPRSAIFNVTGGCYFWQFTIKDGQTTSESPLYDVVDGTGKVYYDPNDFSKLAAPNYSHHKLTVFEYADTEELGIFYRKISKAFSEYQPSIDQPGEFDQRVQENRIVGPLSDSRVIESLRFVDATSNSSIPASTTEITVTTKVDHGYFAGQFVAISNTEIDDVLEGIFQIKSIDQNDARKFTYEIPFVATSIGNNIQSEKTVNVDSDPALGQNAQTLAEVDSVESASPYVFNCSIRSTWGICGIWANGLKATGFKSMVIAQYTGVSLQKDDRAFIRYDEYTNTWNQASLVDAFATVPYHTKGDSYWKDEWRNFHVRASDDAFIQNVSIFAVGFADHFLMESGGDMSITNSNSNFGNTSLHAIGFKGFAFNQDKGGYITDIIPPAVVVDNEASTERINYYTIDIQGTLKESNNYTKLFLGNDDIIDPLTRPAATINGYRLGAKTNDRLNVKLENGPTGDEFFYATLEPTGFVKYVAKGSILNPQGGVVNSVYADAANLIESNRRMIQEEVFGYILEKYPALQNIPYVNPGLNPAGNRYFDARNLIAANRQYIVDTAFDDMITTYGSAVIEGIGDGKCKRDIGLIVDAVAEDLKDGGNANIIAATREYFDGDGNPLTNGLVGEETYATYAFRRARDLCKLAIANLLPNTADLYDPDPNSNLAPYGINVGKTGSQAEADGDTTNGVTIDLALKADPASRYKDARNRIAANREFILDAAVAEVAVYHPDFYHSVDPQTNSQSRLADAFRLIRRNSSEIRDKALAQIAVDHPNFYIDGDNQVDEGSRYASAYRLIQNNRDQIIDTALAQTTVEHPDYFIPGDQQTDARSRYADGYRLIVQNRTEIVNTAWADMLVSYPAHGQYEEKCKRDLGIFVDAIGLDLFVGGNKYTRKFIQEYFTSSGQWITGGLQGEESQSIEAFNQARDQMKLAVANQLSVQDLSVTPGPAQYGGGGGDVANNNSGACDDVQSAIVTLTDIVTTQVAAGNLNALPAETSYIAGPGEEKCRRDIGIFVDSLALDLFCKGNVYSYRFAAEFFENATTTEFSFNSAVYNTNINKAADMIKKAITNQLYEKDLFRTADNAPGSAYGQLSKDFTPHGATYDAATGDMVLDIANHGLSDGDRVKIADGSLTFNCTMDGNSADKSYPRNTDPVSNQYIEITSSTTDSITVNVGASPIVEFTPTTGTTYDPNTGLMVLEIGAHNLTAGTHVKLKEESLVFSCGFGGATGAAAEKAYPRSNGNDPFFNTSIEIQSATATTITLQVLTTIPSTNTDPHTFVSATTGAVESGGNYAHTFVSAAADCVNFAGNTDNQLTDAQPFLCSDVQSAVDSLTGIVTNILSNGNLNTMPIEVNYGEGRGPGELKCARDIGYFIDAITVDMYAEGNKHTRTFTEQYFTNATTPLSNGLVGEEAESITAYNTAINEMKRAITNQLYYKDLTVTEGGSTYAGSQSNVGTPTDVTYDATTGTLVTTIVGHGLANGDQIKFLGDSLTFTCDMGTGSPHTWVGGVATNAITVNGTDDKDVTDAAYTPTTGVLELTIGNHSYTSADTITIATDSLTFTCDKDSNATTHTYPRTTDPAFNKSLPIISSTGTTISVNVGSVTGWKTYPRASDPVANTWLTVANKTDDTFEVNVGTSPIVNFDVSDADYNPTTGLMELTIGSHSLAVGTSIKIAPNSLTFECDEDSRATTHTYPRSTDPFYETALDILSVTGTTITVQVLDNVPSTNTTTHYFMSATAGAVISGGNYNHTFVGADTNAVVKQNSAITSRTSPSACADVQSAIDTLGTIITDALTAGNITGGIWNQPANAGTFITGEAKCRRDLGIVVDAVAQDLWFGGNEFTIAATKEYFNGNQLLANGIDATKEVQPAITAFKRAEELMQRALTNTYYDRDLNITLDQVGDPPIVGNIECDAHDMVLENKEFIAKEAYERMKLAYPSYTPSEGNTEQDCLDDVYDVLREIMWDVKFGGNYKTYDVAKGYITNDFNGKTYPQIIQDVERDEVAKVFQEVKSIAIQVIKSETVTVSAGNNLTQVIDPTIVEDWDEGELLPKCGSAVAAVDTLMDIIIQAIGTDSGVGNLDGVLRSTADGPDPSWNKALNIISATATSITVNVGASPANESYPHTFVAAVAGAVVSGGGYDHTFVSAANNSVNILNGGQLTPGNATYNAANGELVLYFGAPHGLTTSNIVSLDDNSLTFSCDMGRDSTTKTYPRIGIDPSAGQNINISAVTEFSITLDIGASPLVEHNVSNAVYDPVSGDIALTIGAHSLSPNTSIKLKEESLIFKCTKDQNVTTHSYPRASGKYQPTAYADGNCSDVLATVNALVDILAVSLNDGNLDNLPPLSNGEWDCANVRGSIETLFDILQDAIVGGTLAGLPTLNTGDFTVNNEASKCFRDVSYIVDAVVNDLRLGGNENSVQAGEAYFVGNSLEYIDGEKTETLDAWNYVGQMATAAMRNFDVMVHNCTTSIGSAIIDVNDTRGIIIGMSVTEYTPDSYRDNDGAPGLLGSNPTPVYTNIPEGTYVKNIISNTQVELGVKGSRLSEGVTVNALQNSTTVELYFVYENGIWADTLPNTVTVGPESEGPDVIADTTVTGASNGLVVNPTRECSGTADAIETLVGNITTIINSGLGTVTRQEQTVNTALLASRATVFTIDTTGSGPSNPHDFETGTPVRLVPRPRFDQTTGKYVDVDKRLVRLPNGFETNRTYYVIAPGRNTQPENYGITSFFNGSDQTRLMLATSKENAAAGIYIYASETDAIDKDVEIDLYQFVLDDKYDLHNYKGKLSGSVIAGIETDVSHIFDVPNAGVTPQKAFIRAVEGGVLPLISQTYVNNPNVAVTDPQNSAVGRINPNVEFFTRYQNNKTLTLHLDYTDAINNINPVTFASGQSGLEFEVYANKRRSPMKFDPGFTDAIATNGKWYIQCKDEVTGKSTPAELEDNIFYRIAQNDLKDRPRSTDMWYERLKDMRDKDERTYKLRMVIPKYLENARDPINGFVLKTRTDDTRKLVPQKVLLKPVVGNVYGARFRNPVDDSEFIGDTSGSYDPFKKDQTGAGIEYRSFARFTSGIQATIQSGRKVKDALDDSIEYTELTLFDHAVDVKNFPGLRNETFTTVKITAPQGGIFVTSKVDNQASDPNAVNFTGNSSGLANIHAYYTVNGNHYLIIKNVRNGDLEYSEYFNTRFQQGTVFADMLEDQDMGKSLPLKTQIAKNNPQFFYKQNGANVYTITPGDRIQDDAGVEYYVESVEDTGIIEDTFYIFGYETLQKRIAGQQDGIYYLTALRGNMSPFPVGAGITNNFKKFKFSQPVSKLYPLNYRNDPLWFKSSGTSDKEKDVYAGLIDPPATFSAADNYVHGLVTVNDFKGSVTKEMVVDLTEQPAFRENVYTIQAQSGNATSGSENRKIPIGGTGDVSFTDKRYYVELRRPSIARAGNHTFEYLGFGPGNYSTGLPARQEIVLTPDEDFYAQSKKQDGGIVFYTGINSQGDLYIGNRRINAITGEETFIDAARLNDDGDEDDVLDGLVTTFDTPVTFNQNITVVGGDGELVNNFESPITISVQDEDLKQSRFPLIIRSYVEETDQVTGAEQDETLDRQAFTPVDSGDIVIGKNRIDAAIFAFNARGNGQDYMFQTHTVGGVASNITPNQDAEVTIDSNTGLNTGGTRINSTQLVNYTGVIPSPGDFLLKGQEVGKSGSLGWILSNYFSQVPGDPSNQCQIDNIEFDGTNVVKISFRDLNSGVAIPVGEIGIKDSSQIRLKNFYSNDNYSLKDMSLTWIVYSKPGDPFASTNNYCHFQIITPKATDIIPWENFVAGKNPDDPDPTFEFSNSNWKEVGVLGGEALRTDTESIGDYRLGINTVTRLPHEAYKNAFTGTEADPRANLDVVGTVFISGRTTADFLNHPEFADRDKTAVDNAFLVGGDSLVPNDEAVLRVATTNSGRVGINVDNSQLDRALVVDGTSRFTDDAKFEHDIEVNGDDGTTAEIRTSQTSGTFNLVTDNTFTGTLNLAGDVEFINIGNVRTLTQTINIGDNVSGDQFVNIANTSEHVNIDLGATPDNRPSDNANTIAKINIGGAYDSNESLSFTRIKTKSFKVDGDFQLGARRTINDTVRLSTGAGKVSFFSDSGSASIVDFALNASEINIAGQGGLTTINNQLRVIASAQFDGNILMCGGVASFSFLGDRGQLGSSPFAHDDGVISDTLFNKNIDILNVLVKQTTEEGYNQVDTAGSGGWGGAAYQQAVQSIGGSPVVEPQVFPLLTGDEFYLPIKNKPEKTNGDPYFVENDYIIINSAVSASGHPEIVQIIELTRTSVAPYYLKVKRQPLGTYTAILENHPDTTPIYKVNVQFDATWTEQNLDSTGPQDNVYLAEFGGVLTSNDYVIIDREDTTNDGIFNQGEVIKVVTPLEAVEQTFKINSDCSGGDANDVFVVNSVTGDTTILGDTTINNSLNIKGGCGTLSNILFTGTATAGTNTITGVTVTSPGKTISDIELGDTVVNVTNESSIDFLPDVVITAIDPVNNEFVLSRPTVGSSSASVGLAARRNEQFLITDGNQVPTFKVDSCSGTTHIGNQYGRFDIEYASAGDTASNTAGIPGLFDNGTIKRAYGYMFDPQHVAAGGPDTTIGSAVAGSAGQIQIPVESLGVGSGAFAVDDLVFVGTPTATSTQIGDFSICKITQIITNPANPTIVVAAPGDGLKTENSFDPSNAVFAVGNTVRRVLKHPEIANIIDVKQRTRVNSGASTTYISMIIDKGHISQQKLDYAQFLALADNEGDAQIWVKVAGRLKGDVHQTTMNEQIQDGAIGYRSGNTTVNGDFRMLGGSLQIFDSVNQTRLFALVNDDGHADHQGLLTWDAGVTARGDFYLFSAQDPENVVLNPDATTPSFSVDNLGNVTAEKSFTVNGVASDTPSTSFKQFALENLGPNGTEELAVKQDSSIDAFGISNFVTSSGAKHARYISSASAEEDLTLLPNIVYMVNTTASSTLVLTMPSAPQTGDVVRITDIGGNLSYNTSLVLRTPESSGTRIQGDNTGTLLGGRITPYPSGELVVQTPNAAFALVYLGGVDSNGQVGIPTSVQGWWLTEV